MPGRIRALGALAVVTAAGTLPGCGGGGSSAARDAVRTYVERVNTIQRQDAGGVAAANAAYAAVSQGKLAGADAQHRLQTAQDDLRALRQKVAAVDAPAPARALRRDLLRVLALDVGLATEAEQLVAYVPAAQRAMRRLPAAGRRLRTRLRRASAAPGQQAALTAYGGALSGIETQMRALDPPPVLLDSHRGQLLRLDRARSLSRGLRSAIGRADAPAIATLLVRFQRVNDVGAVTVALQRAAVRAYQRRLRAVSEAAAATSRELADLQRTLR